jgi:hypothetical protein
MYKILADSKKGRRLGYYSISILIVACLVLITIGFPKANRTDELANVYVSPKLLYGYAAPTVQPIIGMQVSEFNSFIGHQNESELYNTTNQNVTATIDIINFDGQAISSSQYNLPPNGSKRITLDVPIDTYGTLIINGDGVVFRNYVKSNGEYVMTFMGK